MAKNKRKKTPQNKGHELFKTASADELRIRGTELLNSGKYRDAIETLKMAAKKGTPRQDIDPLLFKAYSLRAAQLREKGMHVEAAAVNQLALPLMPSNQELSEEALFAFIKTSGFRQAVSIYAKYLNTAKASEAIETWLAEIFLIHQEWDVLDLLTDKSLLKKDARSAMTAVGLMNQGEWETALTVLKPVPRTSPWAVFRLLCHAMVCFYKEDDVGMQRAIGMIPENSAIKPLTRQMIQNVRDIACLWDGPMHLENDIDRIFDEIARKHFKNAENAIQKAAAHVYPQNPPTAVFHILEMLWPLVIKDTIYYSDYERMGHSLLSKDLNKLLSAKTGPFSNFKIPFREITHYLPLLSIEFQQKEDQDIAAGGVILYAIEKYLKQRGRGDYKIDNFEALRTSLKLAAKTHEGLLAESLMVATGHDPGNRNIYERLAALPAANREAKKYIEEGLLRMNAHFPGDPFPCLELARLYYTKNAFRKAETILDEAAKRAPHDIRVVNMRVMSLLISADKNFKRGSLDLASQDIEKAAALESPALRFLVVEKKLLLKMAGQGQMPLFKNIMLMDAGDAGRKIDDALEPMTSVERLKTLGTLYLDMNNFSRSNIKGFIFDAKLIRVVDQILTRHLATAHHLSHTELLSLLAPKPLALFIDSAGNFTGLFIKKAKANLLKLIDNDHLLPIFDNLIADKLYKIVLQETIRRKKTAPKKFWLLLRFYEITIRHFTKELVNNYQEFWNIIEQIPKEELEALRLASRRLATFAEDKSLLKKAMSAFDFHLLDPSYGFWDDNDYYDNDNDGDDDDDDDDFDNDLKAELYQFFIKDLEKIVAAEGLKGAPVNKLIKLRNDLQKGSIPMALAEMGLNMDKAAIQNLSREVRILIFGKP